MMLTSTEPHQLIKVTMEHIGFHASSLRLAAEDYEQTFATQPNNDAKLDAIGALIGEAGGRLARAIHNYRMVRDIQGNG